MSTTTIEIKEKIIWKISKDFLDKELIKAEQWKNMSFCNFRDKLMKKFD